MEPQKETVTDKIAKQGLRRFIRQMEISYERSFPYVSACPSLWERADVLQAKLTTYLAKRPLQRVEIDAAVKDTMKVVVAVIRDEATKVKQPRYREATDIETGVVRLIPDYGE